MPAPPVWPTHPGTWTVTEEARQENLYAELQTQKQVLKNSQDFEGTTEDEIAIAKAKALGAAFGRAPIKQEGKPINHRFIADEDTWFIKNN